MGLRNTFSTTITDVGRNNTLYVESLNSFVDPVSDVITLQDFNHYIFTKPINTGTNQLEISDNGTVQFSTTNAVVNFLNTELTGTTPLFFGNIRRLIFANFNIISTVSGGHCFDLSKDVVTGFVSLDQANIVGFDSIGTIEGSSLSAENMGLAFNGAGLTLKDMDFVVFREALFSGQTGDHIILTGTLIGAIFDSNIAEPASGDALFNIDSGITITEKILIHNNLFDDASGGTLFDSGGLDQTDPKVIAFNNGNALDSYWVGSLGFKENTTATTVLLNTYTDIAGTILAGVENERYTVSGGELTYIGLEDIKTQIEVSISASRTTPASSGRTIRAAVFIDSGSGFVEQADSFSMTMRGDVASFSFRTKPIILTTGDIIKAQIKNEDTADNILVVDYNLSGPKT